MKGLRGYLGKRGESLAAQFLRQRGYRISQANFRCPLGEIDLIAREGGTTIFVEVRTCSEGLFGRPEETIGPRKQEKLRQLATWYLSHQGTLSIPCRFDVVSVVIAREGPPEIALIRDAF